MCVPTGKPNPAKRDENAPQEGSVSVSSRAAAAWQEDSSGDEQDEPRMRYVTLMSLKSEPGKAGMQTRSQQKQQQPDDS